MTQKSFRKMIRASSLSAFSFGASIITGLLGLIGALGLCSTPWVVGFFALLGVNSMFLSAYNRLFILLALFFFILASVIYFKGSRKSACKNGQYLSFNAKTLVVFLTLLIFFLFYLQLNPVGYRNKTQSGKAVTNEDLLEKVASLEKMIRDNDSQVKEEIQSLKGETGKSKSPDLYAESAKTGDFALPSGVPPLYGEELGLSFDKVQEAIDKVSPFDPTYGLSEKKISLTAAERGRYTEIGSSIACEYCCGVKTLVFENGEAACSCAHSQMMRGLAAYLIKNHPNLSNEEILEELAKWKATFFPKETLAAQIKTTEKAGDSGTKQSLGESPESLPEMVGGC